MPRECKDIREIFSKYLDEDLNSNEMKEVEDHLLKCNNCQEELKALAKTINMVRKLPRYFAPSSVVVNINKKLNERKNLFQKVFPVSFKISVGSIALIAVGILVVQLYNYIEQGAKEQYQTKQNIKEPGKIDKLEDKTVKRLKNDQEDRKLIEKNKALDSFIAGETPPPEPPGKTLGVIKKYEKVDTAEAYRTGREDSAKMLAGSNAENTVEPPGSRNFKSAGKQEEQKGQKNYKDEQPKGESLAASMKPETVESSFPPFAQEKAGPGAKEKGYAAAEKTAASKDIYFSGKKSTMCDYKTKANLIIKNNEEWKTLWQKAFPDNPVPVVDFNSKMAAAAFSGEKPSGGYEIDIKDVNYGKDKVIVTIKENIPPKNAFLITVMTSPFCIKVIDKSDLPVEFINE